MDEEEDEGRLEEEEEGKAREVWVVARVGVVAVDARGTAGWRGNGKEGRAC